MLRKVIAGSAAALCGGALLAFSVGADRAWFERHVLLPYDYLPKPISSIWYVRGAAAALGALFLAVAPGLSRWAAARSGKEIAATCARVGLALVLALCAAELVLRRLHLIELEKQNPRLEFRLGSLDDRFGWSFIPSRTTVLKVWRGTRDIHYAINSWSNRARTQDDDPDPARPSLVFAGESIVTGHGLEYDETFPALVGAQLGLQVVNLAVGGYGSDQAYLRLADTLPRLAHPVAVVTLFHAAQLYRNVQDYRPRLVLHGEALELEPAADGPFSHLRLRNLFFNELPFLGESTLQRSLAVTAKVLRKTAEISRARGAAVVFLVPTVGVQRSVEEHPEAPFLHRLFDAQGLHYLLLDIPPERGIPNDGHPDAIAQQQIATALVSALSH